MESRRDASCMRAVACTPADDDGCNIGADKRCECAQLVGRWRMDGKRAEGMQKIHALIASLRDDGLVLSLEAVYSHSQADGSIIVAAVGLVARDRARQEASAEDDADTEEEAGEGEGGESPTTFVEVFVLKQKAGMGGYFVTDDMLHLLSGPLEAVPEPRSPSVFRQRLREMAEELHAEREARAQSEDELQLLKSHVTSSGMEIQMLRQSLDDSQSELEGKREEVQELTAHVADLETASASNERELIADLDAKHKAAVEHVERQLSALQQQLQHSSRTRDDLRAANDDLINKLAEARAQCRALKEQVDTYKGLQSAHEREQHRAQLQPDETQRLRRHVEALTDDLRESKRAAQEANQRSEALEARERKTRNLADSLNEKRRQLEDELKRSRNELDRMRAHCNKARADANRFEHQHIQAQEQLKSCRVMLKEKDKNRSDDDGGEEARSGKPERGADLKQRGDLSTRRQDHEQRQRREEELQATTRALEGEGKRLSLQVEELQESLKAREQDVSRLQSRLLTLQEDRDAAQAQSCKVDALAAELAAQRAATLRAEDEVIAMRQNMEMLSHHLQEARAAESSKDEDARAAKKDVLAAQRECTHWKNMYESSQTALETHKKNSKDGRDRVKVIAAEKEALDREGKSLRERAVSLAEQLGKLQCEKAQADEMLARAEESIIDEQQRSATLRERYQQDLIDVRPRFRSQH